MSLAQQALIGIGTHVAKKLITRTLSGKRVRMCPHCGGKVYIRGTRRQCRMQAKRIQVNEGNDTASGETTVRLQVPTEPREQVNFHNIWIGVTVEPVTAGANCQGWRQ